MRVHIDSFRNLQDFKQHLENYAQEWERKNKEELKKKYATKQYNEFPLI